MPGRRPLTVMLALAVLLGIIAAPASGQEGATDDALAAVLPDHREAVAAQARDMPEYTIAATFLLPPDAEPATAGAIASPVATSTAEPFTEPRIVGTVDLDYTNTTGKALNEVYIRLTPNLRQYGSGSMAIGNVHVAGEPVEVQPPTLNAAPDATPIAFEDAGASDLAIVRIPLVNPLAPGEATSVRMDFSTTVPVAPSDESRIFRYVPETGTWTVAHWFPMLAGHDPETGWDTDPPAAWSDITFSETALFDVTLTTPEELVVVTTGVEVDAAEGAGVRTVRTTTGAVRDVAIVADPNLSPVSTEVAGTTITSWHRPGEEAGSEVILEWASQAFAVYSDLFGPYPYTTLDLVSVPGVLGYEAPQLLFVSSDFYPDPEALGSRPGAVEFLVAHEVAHQWWYGLVGSNPHANAFLDEGLAEYSAILYFERQDGKEVADSHLRDGLVDRYALLLVTAGDEVADQPTVDFPDAAAYYTIAYRKAGLRIAAIREEIGDEAFFDALRSYAERHRFGVATPETLLSAFEAASGQELDALWELWFESDRGRVEIVMEPLPATPAPEASPAATPIEGSLVATPDLGPSPVASPQSLLWPRRKPRR